MSLFNLSETVKKNNPLNIQLHTHITKLLNNYTKDDLQSIKFNDNYTKNNIRFYNTTYIPKFLDKQPLGVTNTEYESNLTLVQPIPTSKLLDWPSI